MGSHMCSFINLDDQMDWQPVLKALNAEAPFGARQNAVNRMKKSITGTDNDFPLTMGSCLARGSTLR